MGDDRFQHATYEATIAARTLAHGEISEETIREMLTTMGAAVDAHDALIRSTLRPVDRIAAAAAMHRLELAREALAEATRSPDKFRRAARRLADAYASLAAMGATFMRGDR